MPAQQGGKVMGWDLYSTLQQQAAYLDYYKTNLPVACPNDGTPLLQGPPQEPGVLYCPHDGWRYPDDYDADTMSGM
jgi:hypothetical protein